jgi:hypothetical protein
MNNNMFPMYQNSGYNNTRNRKRTLILDVDDISDKNLGKTGTFKVNLFEPLIIDKHSEVYLDNFTSYNSNLASNLDLTAFCLKINEFNMNSNVASSRSNGIIYNSLVIPNEHRNPDNFQTSVVHKGKKFNYVCDINPGTINSLSGKITDLGGNPAFHDSTGTGAFTYTIIGIVPALFEEIRESSRDGATSSNIVLVSPTTSDTSITGGQTITSFNIPTGITTIDSGPASDDAVIQPSGMTGNFIVTTSLTGSTLTFTTSAQITDIGSITLIGDHTKISGAGDIYFQTGSDTLDGAIRINNTTGENPALTIIEGHGRFIAEFSIISRE